MEKTKANKKDKNQSPTKSGSNTNNPTVATVPTEESKDGARGIASVFYASTFRAEHAGAFFFCSTTIV